jgi:hypothetical protein
MVIGGVRKYIKKDIQHSCIRVKSNHTVPEETELLDHGAPDFVLKLNYSVNAIQAIMKDKDERRHGQRRYACNRGLRDNEAKLRDPEASQSLYAEEWVLCWKGANRCPSL